MMGTFLQMSQTLYLYQSVQDIECLFISLVDKIWNVCFLILSYWIIDSHPDLAHWEWSQYICISTLHI